MKVLQQPFFKAYLETVKTPKKQGIFALGKPFLHCGCAAAGRIPVKRGGLVMGNIQGSAAQWEQRFSADLLPQSDSVKNGKYTKYSSIFHTFPCVKISRRKSLPHYAVLP